jgi:hypothetical protein
LIVTVVHDGRTDEETIEFGAVVARLLTGRPPDNSVAAADPAAVRIVARSSVVVIATSVDGGTVPAEILALADARPFAPRTLVVPASLGPWPAESVTLDRLLVPLLARGGVQLTPVLHLPRSDSETAVLYCRRWAPVVAWLARSAEGFVA